MVDKRKKKHSLQWIEEEMEKYGFVKMQEATSSTTLSDVVVVEYSKDEIFITFHMKFREVVNLFIEAEYSDGTPLGSDYKKITSIFIFEVIIKKFLKEKIGLEKC